MRSTIVALVTVIALLTTGVAGPRKVLVLPLDGNAPAAQKTQLNDTIKKLAKAKLTGDVTTGEATFAETATAAGCDPAQASCAEKVRAMLSVDEMIYGSAKTDDGSTTIIVYRASKGAAPTSQITVIADKAPGASAGPGIEPVFGGTKVGGGTTASGGGTTASGGGTKGSGTTAGSGAMTAAASTTTGGGETAGSGATTVGSNATAGAGSGSDAEAVGSGSAAAPPQQPHYNFFDTRERKLGIGLAAGAVIAMVIGVSFWSSERDLQGVIDKHPRMSLTELQALHDLEEQAASKALWGNIMVGVGLGLGAAGAYFLYKDHKNRGMTVAPAPAESGGMTLVLGGRW